MGLSDLAQFDAMAPLKAFEMGRESGLARLAQQNKMKLGNVLSSGDYKSGAKAAFGFGMLGEGSALAKLAADEQEMAYKQQQEKDKQARVQMLGQAVAGSLPGNLASLAQLDPRMAIQLHSANQTNMARNEPKPPMGYRFDDGGNLNPIKGGPADPTVKNSKNSRLSPMPAELASRIGLAKNFMKKYDTLKTEVEGGVFGEAELSLDTENAMKRANLAIGRGKQGEMWRELKGGSEALTRMLTGAGMNVAEAKNEVAQYLPTAIDTNETILSKMSQLNERLQAMVTEASAGRVTAGPVEQPQGADGVTNADIGGVPQNFDLPNEAVELLASDPSPEARVEFDQEFGEGASSFVLGQ